MNKRKLELGDKNIVGAKITEVRLIRKLKLKDLLAKLQVNGVDISLPALSLLEGQKRPASDIEIKAIADILDISADWLLGRKEE